jgi:hypothetical protein
MEPSAGEFHVEVRDASRHSEEGKEVQVHIVEDKTDAKSNRRCDNGFISGSFADFQRVRHSADERIVTVHASVKEAASGIHSS